MELNPTMMDYFYQHPDVTLFGLVWSAAWRLTVAWLIFYGMFMLVVYLFSNKD